MNTDLSFLRVIEGFAQLFTLGFREINRNAYKLTLTSTIIKKYI